MGTEHDHDEDLDDDVQAGRARARRPVARTNEPPRRDDRRRRGPRRRGAPPDRNRVPAGRSPEPDAAQPAASPAGRSNEQRIEDLEQQQRQQQQQVQSLGQLSAAAERMRQAYHNVSGALQAAFVPFRIAYEGQQAALTARARRIEATRMFFIDLFLVGVAGFAGGLVQQAIRDRFRDVNRQYTWIVTGGSTTLGDVTKFTRAMVSPALANSPPGQQPTMRAPASGASPAPASPAPQQQGPQGAAPQGAAPQGAAPQAAAPQGATPQDAAPAGGPAQAPGPAADPIGTGLDPITWLASTLAHIHQSSGAISGRLSEMFARVSRGDVPPPGSEDPLAFVNRLVQPIEEMCNLPVRSPQEYSRLLWTQWLHEFWIRDSVRNFGSSDGMRAELERAELADRGLRADIRRQCGSDEVWRAAITHRQGEVDARVQERNRRLGVPEAPPRRR